MNLKPFNIEDALAGKPVVTRDGRKVTEIYHFKTADQKLFPVTGIIDGGKYGYSLDGFFISGDGTTNNDLFMAPETLNVWINVWMYEDGKPFCVVSDTPEQKVGESVDGFIHLKTVPVTIEL